MIKHCKFKGEPMLMIGTPGAWGLVYSYADFCRGVAFAAYDEVDVMRHHKLIGTKEDVVIGDNISPVEEAGMLADVLNGVLSKPEVFGGPEKSDLN